MAQFDAVWHSEEKEVIYQALKDQIDSDPDLVASECTRLLNENPDDWQALFLLGYVYSMAERFGLAVTVFHRLTQLAPKKGEGWNNLGMAYHGLKDTKALGSFMTAWGLEKKASYAANIGSAYLEQCRWKEALEWELSWCEKQCSIYLLSRRRIYGMAQ